MDIYQNIFQLNYEISPQIIFEEVSHGLQTIWHPIFEEDYKRASFILLTLPSKCTEYAK